MYSCNCKNVFYVFMPVGTCLLDKVSFGMPAPQAGEYVMKLSFLNEEITIKSTLQMGADVAFNTVGLNENYEWVATVYNPDGTQLKKPYTDGKEFDCFSFRTTLKLSL